MMWHERQNWVCFDPSIWGVVPMVLHSSGRRTSAIKANTLSPRVDVSAGRTMTNAANPALRTNTATINVSGEITGSNRHQNRGRLHLELTLSRHHRNQPVPPVGTRSDDSVCDISQTASMRMYRRPAHFCDPATQAESLCASLIQQFDRSAIGFKFRGLD